MSPKRYLTRCSLLGLFGALLPLAVVPLHLSAQTSAGTATVIAGRVQNAGTGNYLNNVRISLAGTTTETFTDKEGDYRLLNVPAGEVTLQASFTGFPTQTATVTAKPGEEVRHDFALSVGTAPESLDKVMVLDVYRVNERVLSGQAEAQNEKRFSPNIKDVVVMEGYPDVGEGDIGEYLKYVPGVHLLWNPQEPSQTMIRGMPNSGTIITINGIPMASTGTLGRSVDLATAATGNMQRIDITKTPTPDLPANAVGGSINMVTKNGFGRQKPLLTYSVFGTYTSLNGYRGPAPTFDKAPAVDDSTDRYRVQPSYSLSYLLPVNKNLAFTFAVSGSDRYSAWQPISSTWNTATLNLTSATMMVTPWFNSKVLYNGTMDWKITERDAIQFSAQYSKQTGNLRQNAITTTYGAGSTSTPDSAQGAATGVGTVSQGFGWNNQYKPMKYVALSYRHDGDGWKLEAALSRSRGSIALLDTNDGFFGNVGSVNIPNVIIRSEGTGASAARNQQVPNHVITDRTGNPVDYLNGDNYSIGTVTASNRWYKDAMDRAALDFTKDLPHNASLKVGGAIDRRHQTVHFTPQSWTFTPPGGTAAKRAGNYDLISTGFASEPQFEDYTGKDVTVRFISMKKLYDLYTAHPDWFVLDQTAAYTGEANASNDITETVSAAYVRGDLRFFKNRLWLVGGVRFEHTSDDGAGVLNDISATYARDANGNIIRGSNGVPTKKTGTALDLAKLQYTLLGARSVKSYSGYYPSLNASFSITDKLVLRAAYAKTIGRPDFTNIVPNIAISDQDGTTNVGTITTSNPALKPWSSNNYDLTLEAYDFKGATISVSLFRKDLTDFFARETQTATTELLKEFGLDDDYLGYQIVTTRNSGSASITGLELSWRQSLNFLPGALKGLQPYASLTCMHLSGPDSDQFTNFVPATYSVGLNYILSRFSANVTVSGYTVSRNAVAAASASVPANSYTWFQAKRRIDASVEYRFIKRMSAFISVRNASGNPQVTGTWNDTTPAFARGTSYQNTGALWSAGVKGVF